MGSQPFQEALESCRANGGDLATAKDAGEAQHIHTLLSALPVEPPPSGQRRFWMGLQLPRRHCSQQHKPLRGFLWTSGGEETTYTNWAREPRGTCTARRCVHVAVSYPGGSSGDFKWSDGVCSPGVDGYLCKFSFKGMCQAIELSGPGSVTYSTPFNAKSPSLTLVPFGSLAAVSCEGTPAGGYVLCLEQGPALYGWSTDGPFCAPATGCSTGNGGCAQVCVDDGAKSHHCQCHAGYQLGSDQHSCQLLDHCQGHPCEYRCLNSWVGFQCTCPPGYELAEDGRSCLDADECARASPCPQLCINSPGSFRCDCAEGFTLVAGRCQDLDECSSQPCAQACQNTAGSYRCHCGEGYVSSGHSCIDLDECVEHPCQGTCSNTEGSFECSCGGGYTLAADRVSCAPKDVTTTLLATALGLMSAGGGQAPTPAAAPRAQATPLGTTPGHTDPTATQSGRRGGSLRTGQGSGTVADFSSGSSSPVTLPTAREPPGRDRTPNQVKTQEEGRVWLLPCVLGSVAALLLLLCPVALFVYRRHSAAAEKVNKAGDFYSWIQAAGSSSLRIPGKAAVCNPAADNYMELEANQTAV
ncbi:complement component C1q receptor-like [Carcharodon carcharias]|uniref:complement component C1q receptor-like n=1 Tax=Carcharodon carcharias TaxID=13397 RepID=UPI001B7E2BB3|nr:complement component C1q receptor-like [Carcharodon carcharias]